jgi:cell division protein FtsB
MKIVSEKPSGYVRVLVVLLILLTIGIFMGEKGKLRRENLLRKKATLQERNKHLSSEIRAIEQQVTLLRTDPRMIERVAKRTLGMARPNETVYIFNVPNRATR